jgi:uncharacterized repeat protein (TIGR03803 family)
LSLGMFSNTIRPIQGEKITRMDSSRSSIVLNAALLVASSLAADVASAATFSVLHSFGSAECTAPNTDGLQPTGLVMSGALLYGVTDAGPFVGGATEGSIYSLDPVSGQFQTIVGFQPDPMGPKNPAGRLAPTAGGSFYATTEWGGTGSVGTILKFTPGAAVTIVYSFAPRFDPYTSSANPDGANPQDGVLIASDGTLWGITPNGGADGNGTVFHLDPATGLLTQIHSFSARAADFTNNDGAYPVGGLTLAGDGNLYGVTSQGGSGNTGTIFSVNPTNGEFSVIHAFAPLNGSGPGGDDNADGALAVAGLTAANDGTLYGVTCSGGSTGVGTAFHLAPSSALFTTLTAFPASSSANACPNSRLLLGSDGNFYGTTRGSSGISSGLIFRMSPGGSISTLHAFDQPSSDPNVCAGAFINNDGLNAGDLMEDNQGNLYGVAASGGLGNAGTVFVVKGAISGSSGGSPPPPGTSSGGGGGGGGSLQLGFLVALLALSLVRYRRKREKQYR